MRLWELGRRALTGCVAAVLLSLSGVSPARAQSNADAMKKLSFLLGEWQCVVEGGTSNGLHQVIRYSFSSDGLWMTELSHDANSSADWETQIWGYDSRTRRLTAYQFVETGIFTKTVDGWKDGVYVSHRDDNGASVSLKRLNDRSMKWIIASADGSYVVTEECVRK